MRLQLAIADLSERNAPNYGGMAKEFKVDRTALRRRFQGEQASGDLANSKHRQCLTIQQEETLIEHIMLNKLGSSVTSCRK
jgi:hypothetical protein